MAKVKIGDREYEINHLKVKDVKKILKDKTEKKLDDLDYNTHVLVCVINEFNPDAKLTIEQLDELIDISEFERIQKEILESSGLKEYFKAGVGNKQ